MPSHPFRSSAPPPPPPRPSWAWVGLLAAPVAWAVHIGARYPLVQVACDEGTALPLHAVSAVCLAVAGLGLVAAMVTTLRARRAQSHVSEPDPERELALRPPPSRRLGRIGLVARAGVVNSAVFVGAIVLEAGTALVHDPCTRFLL